MARFASRYRPALEALETRAVPAVVSMSLNARGALQFQCDNANDHLEVTEQNGSIVIHDLPTNAVKSAPAAAVKALYVYGSGGNDQIISTADRPSFFFGGAGNDVLR